MGFIYSKPLSIEGVFAKFDTDRNGTISHREYNAAQQTDIFTSFKINKNMTLFEFETFNRETYANYEKNMTEKHKKQEKEVQQWLMQEQTSLQDLQETEIKELERLEQKLEKEKEELELTLAKKKEETDLKEMIKNTAKQNGYTITDKELSGYSIEVLRHTLDFMQNK